jgi:hypothetical protein
VALHFCLCFFFNQETNSLFFSVRHILILYLQYLFCGVETYSWLPFQLWGPWKDDIRSPCFLYQSGFCHRVYRMPVVQTGSPHPLTRKRALLPIHFGSKGETHSLAGVGLRVPNSDEGTDTLVLHAYYNPCSMGLFNIWGKRLMPCELWRLVVFVLAWDCDVSQDWNAR